MLIIEAAGWFEALRRRRSTLALGMVLVGCVPGEPPMLDHLNGIERANREQAIEGVENPDASVLKMADYFRDRGERSTAISLYLRGLENADSARVSIGIGRRLLSLNAATEAAKAYRKAIGIDNDDLEARKGLGLALLKSGRIEESIDYFHRLVRDDRYFSIDVCTAYGASLDLDARHQQAQKAYRKCLEKAPDDLDLRSNLALSLALSGSTAKAIATSENALTHPLAKRPHVRNHVLVLALASREDEALAFGEATLGGNETLQILRRAGKVATLADPVDRARSMGAMLGAGAKQ